MAFISLCPWGSNYLMLAYYCEPLGDLLGNQAIHLYSVACLNTTLLKLHISFLYRWITNMDEQTELDIIEKLDISTKDLHLEVIQVRLLYFVLLSTQLRMKCVWFGFANLIYFLCYCMIRLLSFNKSFI